MRFFSFLCFVSIQVLKVRLSLKKAYIGAGLKHVLATKQGFTKALQELLPNLSGEDEATKNNVTKNSITRQSRLVPALIFQVTYVSIGRIARELLLYIAVARCFCCRCLVVVLFAKFGLMFQVEQLNICA